MNWLDYSLGLIHGALTWRLVLELREIQHDYKKAMKDLGLDK
jgi:hypothetical protein